MVDLTKNYFELFQLPVSCDVDRKLLTANYRELQKTVHPDRFARESERQQRLSVQYTSYVNEAFEALKTPLSRSIYLLKLAGCDVDMENNTIMDPVFLMEQMTLREAVSELSEQSEPEWELDRLMTRVDSDMDQYLEEFSSLWQAGGEKNLKQAESVVRKMQFMVKLATELEQLESKWLDN